MALHPNIRTYMHPFTHIQQLLHFSEIPTICLPAFPLMKYIHTTFSKDSQTLCHICRFSNISYQIMTQRCQTLEALTGQFMSPKILWQEVLIRSGTDSTHENRKADCGSASPGTHSKKQCGFPMCQVFKWAPPA